MSQITIKTNIMENIILNDNNCKEYTNSDFEAKVKDINEGFDMDILFSDELIIEESDSKELTDFQILTLSLLENAKKELDLWVSKKYKVSLKSAFVGDEIGGSYFNVGKINIKRRLKRIKQSEEDIKLYKKDLLNSGYKF